MGCLDHCAPTALLCLSEFAPWALVCVQRGQVEGIVFFLSEHGGVSFYSQSQIHTRANIWASNIFATVVARLRGQRLAERTLFQSCGNSTHLERAAPDFVQTLNNLLERRACSRILVPAILNQRGQKMRAANWKLWPSSCHDTAQAPCCHRERGAGYKLE